MYITNYSVFFQCYFRSRTEILMVVCSFWIFFQESLLERGLNISMNGRFIFSGGFIFRWRRHPIGVASAKTGEGGGGCKKIHGVGDTPIISLPLVCVVTGLKRSMNDKMLWKIYRKGS